MIEEDEMSLKKQSTRGLDDYLGEESKEKDIMQLTETSQDEALREPPLDIPDQAEDPVS